MAFRAALECLHGPLMGISGVIDLVSSYIFQFQGRPVRELSRTSDAGINCITALSDGWAVGDSAGNVELYDSDCERLLRTYTHAQSVNTIAQFGNDNGFVCNSMFGVVFWRNQRSDHFMSHDSRCVFKLVSFPNGLVAACSKITSIVHVYRAKDEGASITLRCLHSLIGPHRVSDVVKCGDMLGSVHQANHLECHTVVWLWDARLGIHLHTIPLACAYVCDIVSPTDDTMAFIDTWFAVHVFNVDTKRYDQYDDADLAYNTCVIPDGRFLTTSVEGDVFYSRTADFEGGDTLEINLSEQHKLQLVPNKMSHLLYIPTDHIVICREGKLLVWK